jgi:hypothetical protein
VTNLHKWFYGGLGVLVLGLLYLAHAYSVRQARAEEQQTATEKTIAIKDQAIADLKRDRAESDARFAQAIANVTTGKQAVTVLQPIISPQGQPAPQTITKADLSPEAQKSIPGPPDTSLHLLTDEQVINAAKRELRCQQTEINLGNCEAEKTLMQAEIDALTKANADWQKAGAVGPWMVALGASRNAGGNGYSPNLFLQRRINTNLGIMAGVEGKGDLSLAVTWNFAVKR